MAMNKSIPRKDENQETIEEVQSRYDSTVKRVGINIKDIKPNYCLCKLYKHISPIMGDNGMALILPGDLSTSDEIVFKVIGVGRNTLDYTLVPEVGDLFVAREAFPVRYKYTTKLEVNGEEGALFHMIKNEDILYKVDYIKL